MFIEIFLAILLVLYPLGQLERIPLPSPEIGFYFHDVVIVGLVIFWLARKILKKEKIKWPKFSKYIFLFAGIAFITWLINIPKRSGVEILVASLYLMRWVGYAGLYFVIKDSNIVKLLNGSIIRWLITIGTIAAGFGLLQYVFYPDIRPLTVYEWDPHYYRVVGTYLEPGFAGLIYVLTLILITVKAWESKAQKLIIHYSLLIACVYVAFVLTYSRSAYVAYILAMFIIAWMKKSWKFLVVALVVFIITLWVLPRPGGEGVKLERQHTFWTRFASWQESLTIWKDQPIFGVGFNFYRYANRDYGFSNKARWLYSHAGAGVDNSFLFVLVTTGVIGLFFYLLMFYKILTQSFKNISQPGKLILVSSFASCALHAIFNNTLFYPWIMIWLWVLLGFYGV
jgi:putative inorganic carbon (HCO3(-)) transporter